MSDMKKLLKIVEEKTTLNEGVNVSINVSGDCANDVGDVLARVTNLSQPKPVTPDMMPAVSAPPPMPMMKALDIVGKMDEPGGPALPPAPPGDEAPPPPPGDMEPHVAPEAIGQNIMQPDPSEGPTDGPSTSSQVGGDSTITPMPTPEEFSDEEVEEEEMDGQKSKGLTMNSTYKEIHDRLREIDQALNKKHEDFKNMPDPKYSDTEYMTKDLAGGLNKPKTMSKHSYKQGDNPMAMEDIIMSEWEQYKADHLDEGYGNVPSVRSWGHPSLVGGKTPVATKGPRKGKIRSSSQGSLKRHIADRLGKHPKPNLPEGH